MLWFLAKALFKTLPAGYALLLGLLHQQHLLGCPGPAKGVFYPLLHLAREARHPAEVSSWQVLCVAQLKLLALRRF